MKSLLIVLLSTMVNQSIFAYGFCSSNQKARGCITIREDCNRPTHYSCPVCHCPKSRNDLVKNYEPLDESQDLSGFNDFNRAADIDDINDFDPQDSETVN